MYLIDYFKKLSVDREKKEIVLTHNTRYMILQKNLYTKQSINEDVWF